LEEYDQLRGAEVNLNLLFEVPLFFVCVGINIPSLYLYTHWKKEKNG